jgi:hypothetical protein
MSLSYTQIKHITRNIKQRLSKVPVGVIGGYHGGNLGDMALGMSVTEGLDALKIRSGLQTIYNLEKWPATPYAIVGGGAVGYSDSLIRVAQRYSGHFDKVALLGVDFNDEVYPKECIDLMTQAAYVSGRSKTQADRIKDLTGRTEVHNHPDIAFSLLNDFCEKRRIQETTSSKKLLINVVPLYGQLVGNSISPVERYRVERPELYKNFEQMHASYKRFIRTQVDKALQDGYIVESIPFTPLDKEFAEFLLQGLPVKHLPYHPDPTRMIKYMSTADRIIATRFHTTIFALKLGIPLTPIAYAKKNELMLEELGVDRSSYYSTEDLALGKDSDLPPIEVSYDKISEWESISAASIKTCIHSLNIK